MKAKMKVDLKVNKTYSYTVGDTTLLFTLSLDTTSELVAFQEMLHAALEEVTNDIEEINAS